MSAGALAASVGHDHHNLMLVGAEDADMLAPPPRGLGGGFVAVHRGNAGGAPLPLGADDQPLVGRHPADLTRSTGRRSLGCVPSPYMALSSLGLAVPELRLTDMGLVDVPQGRLITVRARAGLRYRSKQPGRLQSAWQ